MKFLIDMNLSPLWVAFMADRGFEAIHWSTVGKPGAADSEIFDFPAANGWIVFTHGALVTVDSFRHRVRMLPIQESKHR